jgi:hypothetical protein
MSKTNPNTAAQKPKLNIVVEVNKFYWVRPSENTEFEPVKAIKMHEDDKYLYFKFFDNSILEVCDAWEVEELNRESSRKALKCYRVNVIGRGLTVGAEYEILTSLNDFVCIVDDNNQLQTYHKYFFEQ